MFLQELPSEILTEIFSHLPTSLGPSPIHAALKTCRKLYQVALPFSVQIFRNAGPLYIGEGPCSEAVNAAFLRYILISKPWLAKYVQTIILGRFSSSIHEDDEIDMQDNTENRAKATLKRTKTEIGRRFLSLLPSSQEGESSSLEHLRVYQHYIRTVLGPETLRQYQFEYAQWMADLQRGTSDAQIALILLACPNIKSLYFEEPDDPRNYGFVLKLSRVLSSSNRPCTVPLRNLQEIYSEGSQDEVGYKLGTSEALALLRLPSLRSCEFTLLGGDDETAEILADLAPRSLTVENLTLRVSCCTRLMIYNLLSTFRNLKSFEYTRGHHVGGQPPVLARDILDAILPHAKTLENLHINLWDDFHKNDYGFPQRLYMGTKLRKMTALKRLTIGMQALTGLLSGEPRLAQGMGMSLKISGGPWLEECLPRRLEHLVITGCGRQILDQVSELLGLMDSKGSFSRLECIHLLFNDEHISPEEVTLRPGVPTPRLVIVFQDPWRMVDTGVGFPQDDRVCKAICSRIYAEDFRKRWEKWRGGIAIRLWKPPEGIDNHFLYKKYGLYYIRNCSM